MGQYTILKSDYMIKFSNKWTLTGNFTVSKRARDKKTIQFFHLIHMKNAIYRFHQLREWKCTICVCNS